MFSKSKYMKLYSNANRHMREIIITTDCGLQVTIKYNIV